MNPGEHARGWLDEMGPAPKGGGQCDGVPGNQLLALLAGRRAVRAATATRVGAATGTSAAIWRPGPGPSPQFRAWPLARLWPFRRLGKARRRCRGGAWGGVFSPLPVAPTGANPAHART